MKTYKIPSIFAGTYQVKVQAPNCEEKILEDYSVTKDGEIRVTDFYLTKEAVDEISKTSKEFILAVYNGMDNNDIQSVLPYIAESYKNSFTDGFKEHANTNPDKGTFTYEILDFNSNVNQSFSFEKNEVYVETNAHLNLTFFIEDQEMGEIISPSMPLTFTYENGKWLVTSMPF